MSSGGDFFSWLGQAIVIGLGWVVVHRLSVSRDRDKSRREMVASSADGLAESLSSLLAEAKGYHMKERNVGSELRIKMTLQDSTMRASSLSDICLDGTVLAQCRGDIAALRRAITGRHFEDEHTEILVETDNQLQSIADAALRAKRSLFKLKHLQFPAS